MRKRGEMRQRVASRSADELFFTNDNDGRSVFISCLASMPDTARSAAAQRLHRYSQLVSGLERLDRPAVPSKAVDAVAFETPDHRQRVLAGDRQRDERMRVGIFELPNDADRLHVRFPSYYRA